MKKVIKIEGMSCQHCVMHVRETLENIDGVKTASVDLLSKSAVVELEHEVDDQVLIDAVDEAGYEVKSIEG